MQLRLRAPRSSPAVQGPARVGPSLALGLVLLLAAPRAVRAEEPASAPAKPGSDAAQKPASAPKKASPAKATSARPTPAELERRLAEQRALAAEQQRALAEQQARATALEASGAEQAAALEEQRRTLAALDAQLQETRRRLDELEQQMPAVQDRQALEERLKRIEEASQKVPELPPTVVSAGDFPGSMRIPGTDAAMKLGGRIRASGVLTLDPLGSSDRFVTNTIPVTPDDAAAGTGRRTAFTANTSRFNFDLRTPTGVGQTRAFLEGDFYGTNANEAPTNFRLRHAYGQFSGFVVGQTWSTFSDPAVAPEDLDFEGINGENVIRQPQIRFTWTPGSVSAAVAAETPAVSLTGGKGENIVPDIVARTTWTFREVGHLQAAVVIRQIRGASDLAPTDTKVVFAWGATVSGSLPFRLAGRDDRVVFQLNFGLGNARYVNDLNSLGGQDGAFDPATGKLHAIRARGWYLGYEHQWKSWQTTRSMRLRSSVIWSRVFVDNLDFQPDDAYHLTDRLSGNLVFSPTQRIDLGAEYLYGQRSNKDDQRGKASQIQVVAILRF